MDVKRLEGIIQSLDKGTSKFLVSRFGAVDKSQQQLCVDLSLLVDHLTFVVGCFGKKRPVKTYMYTYMYTCINSVHIIILWYLLADNCCVHCRIKRAK